MYVYARTQVMDALQHLPHSVRYMSGLKNTQVFRFCAIPQIMAVGTLALCYNNGKVFEGEEGGGEPRAWASLNVCVGLGVVWVWVRLCAHMPVWQFPLVRW